MKKLLLFTILAMVFSTNAFADYCLGQRSIIIDNLGNITPSDGETCFENVYNKNGIALVKGDLVILDTGEEDGYSVATSASAGAIPKCVIAEACPSGKVCKCQTYGFADYLLLDTNNTNAATAGQLMFISENTGGFIQAEKLSSIAASDVPIGEFKSSNGLHGATEVISGFIRLR